MMVRHSVAPVGVTYTKDLGMWKGERGLRDCSACTLAKGVQCKGTYLSLTCEMRASLGCVASPSSDNGHALLGVYYDD